MLQLLLYECFDNLTKQDDKGDVSIETTGPAQVDISAGIQILVERLAVLSAYCRADERSNLDAKTHQCIFIGYGLDGEFGHRLYDLVQKKLVRRQDVVFIEDQTIDDIDNTEKEDSPNSGDLTDVNPIPLGPSLKPIQDDVHGDVNDDQHDIEPKCYEEAMESECKDQWVEAMKDELQSLHDNHTFELVKLPKGKRALKKRTILSLAACYDLEVGQMDMKTTFLHGDLEEELYMDHLEGLLHKEKRAKRFSGDNFIILLLYDDDMLIVGRDASRIDRLKQELSKSFSMKDLGPGKQILGIRLSVKHSPSIEKEKEEMHKVRYYSAMGRLMYAMVCTRPYLAYTVRTISWFLANLDIAGDINSKRSTSGYLITYAGGAVAWQSRLRKYFALSTTESEFIAATEACKEIGEWCVTL
ncbi:hypothetical protein GQ457_01G021000 [Hibiscus cannabinus]